MNINDDMHYSNLVNDNKNSEEKNKSNLFSNIIDEPFTPFLYVPSPEEIKKDTKPKIPIPVKFINQSYLIKKLQKLSGSKKNIYRNNNIILGSEKNVFQNFSKVNEDKINENNYNNFNIFNNINKLGPNKPDFFLTYKTKKREKYDKSELCKEMNKSSKSLLNSREYKIKKAKLNLDESIKITESIGDFDINMKNKSKKNLFD